MSEQQSPTPHFVDTADDAPTLPYCAHCAHWYFPATALCERCAGELLPHPVPGSGSVFTYTVNHQPFQPKIPVPYVIALIELDAEPGLRLPAMIVDGADAIVTIGATGRLRSAQTGRADGDHRPAPLAFTLDAV